MSQAVLTLDAPQATLALDAIALDADLQPRAQIHNDVLDDYGQLLVDGVRFPPIVVFFDRVTNWLADGYHRWHAHKALGLPRIAADVRQGSKREALLHSLSANAEHGRQRGSADFRKAYDIAVRNELCAPWDANAVRDLIQCSGRWALELTKRAREERGRERDEAIVSAKASGKNHSEIAKETGVPRKTVVDIVHRQGGGNRSVPFSPPPDPPARPAWRDRLDELDSPGVARWHEVLRVLREINALPSVDEVFSHDYRRIDHAIDQELGPAVDWIKAFFLRYFNEQPARRRA